MVPAIFGATARCCRELSCAGNDRGLGESSSVLWIQGDAFLAPVPAGPSTCTTSGQPARTEIGFDISGISLPFVPCAVRIVGLKEGGSTRGFDLNSVRSRVCAGQNDD